MAYSNLLHKHYDPSNSAVVYISQPLQAAKYLKNGGAEYLVDILYEDTKRENTLVFVFLKSDKIKELYRLWQEHLL